MIPDDDSDDDESYAPSEDEDDKIKVTCVVKSQTPEGHFSLAWRSFQSPHSAQITLSYFYIGQSRASRPA